MNYDQIMTILMFGLHFERPWANTPDEIINQCIQEHTVAPIEAKYGTNDLRLTGQGKICLYHPTGYGQIDVVVDKDHLVDIDVCFTDRGYIYARVGLGHGITFESKWAKDKIQPSHFRDLYKAVEVANNGIFGPNA